ncbi:MAG: hypothetical protein IKE28_09320 [Solobacterium sp.]|nr:hypothetical protein [Solobacterium sp.]
MKRMLALVCAVILLTGCGKAAPSGTAEGTEPSAPVNTEAAGQKETEVSAALQAYIDEMEPYEIMRIAFLGGTGPDRTVDDILKRAAGLEGLSIVSEIPAERIIYGDQGQEQNNVYLIIPANKAGIRVGRYSFYAGEITEVWLDEKEAKPFIYVEDGDSVDPIGMICYMYNGVDDGSSMYTGLAAVPGRLRTDYRMGVVDITPYDAFDSTEIGFYAQSYFDKLCSFEEVQAQLNAGGKLDPMEEMIRDGHAYMVYNMDVDGDYTLYGVTSPRSGAPEVIVSENSGETWETLGRG